ncbi:MAG: MBL fold metallo-hydrolase [Chloroflexi bacterium]|nr:MBL fold metallo-hydrolase [Chloroflexota bacterium]MBP7041190.1 MBL fold metallo-hydrolase [Chloroflexota bacterium]
MSGHTNNVSIIDNQGWDGRILVLANDQLVQTFIIITDRFVALVDTMINAATAVSLLQHARPHLANRHLLIINTHADYDHAWGNQLFAGPTAQHPAPIIASRRCADILRSPESADTLAQMAAHEPDIFNHVILTPPTILFDDQLSLDGGDLTLELFATPGHTPDHISLYIPQIDTLFAADAAELPYPMARTTAGLPAMRQSLAKLAAYRARRVFYCHAPVTTDRQLLEDNIAYFNKLEQQCRLALAAETAVPWPSIPDADLIAAVGLPYNEAVPSAEHWHSVHEYYQTKGHAHQLRAMLEHLTGQS